MVWQRAFFAGIYIPISNTNSLAKIISVAIRCSIKLQFVILIGLAYFVFACKVFYDRVLITLMNNLFVAFVVVAVNWAGSIAVFNFAW